MSRQIIEARSVAKVIAMLELVGVGWGDKSFPNLLTAGSKSDNGTARMFDLDALDLTPNGVKAVIAECGAKGLLPKSGFDYNKTPFRQLIGPSAQLCKASL